MTEPTVDLAVTGPRWTHDRACCRYLETNLCYGGPVDWYYCEPPKAEHRLVMGRYSDEPSEYNSWPTGILTAGRVVRDAFSVRARAVLLRHVPASLPVEETPNP